MYHSNSHSHNYIIMFIIMILSGLLSTMNIWVDKYSDIRLGINDLYMIMLMTGWMFLFMGLFYKEIHIIMIGALLISFNIWGIRTQFLVSEMQYKLGMIPHHSMAVHISKKLLENNTNTNMRHFLKNLINTQKSEIEFLKK